MSCEDPRCGGDWHYDDDSGEASPCPINNPDYVTYEERRRRKREQREASQKSAPANPSSADAKPRASLPYKDS